MITKPPELDSSDPTVKAVYTYAKHGALKQEIIELLRMQPEDFARFQEVFDAGFNEFKHMIRKSQLAHAASNANMAIWLGKQFLNQRDYKDDGTELRQAIDSAVGQAIQALLENHELVPRDVRISTNPTLRQIK